jgi:N-acetylmuramoyl-L-alanine amidase
VAKLVVIDPGHGGKDPGAVGHGLKEKELVLTISQGMERALKRDWEVEVALTRRDNDTFLELDERARFANDRGAAAFVSVHINAAATPAARGFETYRHTGAAVGSGAANIQSTMHAGILGALRRHGVADRHEKSANFAVLRLTAMPAVLTENLFITSGEDAAILKQSAILHEVAEAHALGLARALGLKPKNADDKHRVIADGVPIGTFRDDDKVGAAVTEAVRKGAKRVEVVEV